MAKELAWDSSLTLQLTWHEIGIFWERPTVNTRTDWRWSFYCFILQNVRSLQWKTRRTSNHCDHWPTWKRTHLSNQQTNWTLWFQIQKKSSLVKINQVNYEINVKINKRPPNFPAAEGNKVTLKKPCFKCFGIGHKASACKKKKPHRGNTSCFSRKLLAWALN